MCDIQKSAGVAADPEWAQVRHFYNRGEYLLAARLLTQVAIQRRGAAAHEVLALRNEVGVLSEAMGLR